MDKTPQFYQYKTDVFHGLLYMKHNIPYLKVITNNCIRENYTYIDI